MTRLWPKAAYEHIRTTIRLPCLIRLAEIGYRLGLCPLLAGKDCSPLLHQLCVRRHGYRAILCSFHRSLLVNNEGDSLCEHEYGVSERQGNSRQADSRGTKPRKVLPVTPYALRASFSVSASRVYPRSCLVANSFCLVCVSEDMPMIRMTCVPGLSARRKVGLLLISRIAQASFVHPASVGGEARHTSV